MPRLLLWALLAALALPFAACSPDAEPADDGGAETAEPLVIYSGRKDVLVDPLVERFRDETGLDVQVRYGTDAELLAALTEEGDASPADVFWANTAGTLGAATEVEDPDGVGTGLLTTLPDSLLGVPDAFVPATRLWIPATVRFRVLAYAPGRVDTTALPASVMGLPEATAFQGRIGWTPTYASFIDFITAMRELHGADSTRAWIEGMQALEPKAYPSNTPMIEALVAGEIDVALTNHYYVLRTLHGGGAPRDTAEAPVAIYHFEEGDVGNLALVTGAGVLATSNHPAAHRFLRHLLAPASQAFSASVVFEYPVVRAAELPAYFLPFDRAMALSPAFDFERLRDVQTTARLLRDAGLQ